MYTTKEIAKAYKKYALAYHPDKNPGYTDIAEKNFLRVTEAYVLGGTVGDLAQGFSLNRPHHRGGYTRYRIH